MSSEPHTQSPPPGSSPGSIPARPETGRRPNRGSVKDWSRSSGAEGPAPAPAFDSYDPAGMEQRPAPPAAFVRSLGEFLGDEMIAVREKRDLPWRWNTHPGSGVVTLPWPRHWAFKRRGVRDDAELASFKDHVVVGSWKIPSGPLNWWIAAAEATAGTGLHRERALWRLQGLDPAVVPRGLKIVLLSPEENWMEPVGPDVHLLLAGSPTEFPALDPRAAHGYAQAAARRVAGRF